MKCDSCGKEVFDNGDKRFTCPYCGAEVVVGRETAEERNRRLQREVERQRLHAQIEELGATDHFWTRGNLFSMLDRQSARAALGRGDLEEAGRYLARAEKSLNIGCLVEIIVAAAIILFLMFGNS